MSDVTVRLASPETDLIGIFDLLAGHFVPEHKLGDLTFKLDGVKAANDIFNLALNGWIWLAERDGEIVGSLAVEQASIWWSSDTYIVDKWFYVRPDARKSKAANLLINEAVKLSSLRKQPLIISVYNSGDEDRKELFFKRKGMDRVGCFFVKGFE